MTAKNGIFIVLAGGEGAGKSTVLKRLKESCDTERIVFTREPGGTLFAESLRKLFLTDFEPPLNPFEQLLCIEAARSHHVRTVVAPALGAGKHVITDRFHEATYAYQVIAGDGGARLEELMKRLEEESVGDTEPDLYIYLDVEPEVGLARKDTSGEKLNVFDVKKVDFHIRVREGVRVFLEDKPHEVVDTTHINQDEVYDRVMALLKNHLPENIFSE